jgi:DNA-binding GntR family transcriptional regulator
MMTSPASLKRLKKKSLADETADHLREAIIDGSLPLGQRLLEVDISQQLGISRGTLREALQILESEGIVQSAHGRGKYVMSLTERDVREIYSVRSILEQEAVRLAAENIDEQDILRMQNLLDVLFDAARGQDTNLVIETDFEFHQEIWRIADNQLLSRHLHSIAQQVKIYLAIQIRLYEDLEIGIADHEQIFAAISGQDGEKAAALIREHMDDARREIMDHAQNRQN